MKAVHIFRPGKHTDSSGTALEFDEPTVAAMATAYDPKVHEAPIVVGHPSTDAPAYGWVQGLEFSDGDLVATPHQVDAAFAELVEAGRYKHVSASFYTPDAPSNPVPGGYYLRHVGFLGAQPPAIKGLKPVEFAEDEPGVVSVEFHDLSGQYTIATLWRNLRDWLLTSSGQETADQVVPGYLVEDLEAGARRAAEVIDDVDAVPAFAETDDDDEVDAMTKEELERREAELKAAQEKLDTDTAAFAEQTASLEKREAAVREAEANAFCQGLVREGRLLPAEVKQQVAFMATLDDTDETVEFGEGDAAVKLTALAAYRKTLEARRKAVTFGEHSASSGDDDAADIDQADAVMVGTKARQFREAQRRKGIVMTTREAVAAVQRGEAA